MLTGWSRFKHHRTKIAHFGKDSVEEHCLARTCWGCLGVFGGGKVRNRDSKSWPKKKRNLELEPNEAGGVFFSTRRRCYAVYRLPCRMRRLQAQSLVLAMD